MSRPALFFGSLGLLAALAAGCGTHDSRPRLGEVDRLPRVEIVEPTLHAILPVRIDLAATVEPLERVDLCARVPGVVDVLRPEVDIGYRVRAGEKLVQLAVPDLEAQRRHKDALLDQARKQKLQAEEAVHVVERELQESQKLEKRYAAEYAYARQVNERIGRLVQSGAQQPERAEETVRQLEAADAAWQAAKATIETKRAKLDASHADVDVAESRIRVAEAEVHNLAVMVGYATLTAPFDGVVTKRWVDRGATVKDPSVPLLTLMRTDVVRVLMDVPERDVPFINTAEQNPNADGRGDPVEVGVAALSGAVPGGKFAGNLTRMASALDPATRTMRVEAHLDNRAGHLRPGMYGTATVFLEERYKVLTVPSSALVRQPGNSVEVYCVADLTGDPPRGVVKRLRAELGLDDGLRCEVRGLTGGERIIAKGNGVLREGDRVIAVTAREP